eukprot:TRINITY_DN15608_c0_g1_i1.p1 TRINITY_DN15608_c0_g1~~TRINITY_DN15608_c0_g1_i1.p1  ORF type:complete len:671 (+),score=144.35 TRINITY_DN15608_c0_g1_i1:243-2015(+)
MAQHKAAHEYFAREHNVSSPVQRIARRRTEIETADFVCDDLHGVSEPNIANNGQPMRHFQARKQPGTPEAPFGSPGMPSLTTLNSVESSSEDDIAFVDDPCFVDQHCLTQKKSLEDEESTASSSIQSAHFVSEKAEPENTTRRRRTTVFPSADEMKERVRRACFKEEFNVAQLYKHGSVFATIAQATWFENLTYLVILFNAFWMAHETDMRPSGILSERPVHLTVAENVLCFYFSCEWMIRFLAFEYKIMSVKDGWFIFDTILVLAMIIETWLVTFVTFAFNLEDKVQRPDEAGNMSVLRVFRLVRLVRLARIARLVRAMPELMILIRGLAAGTRSVFFTLCLLLAIIYVFSILLTQMLDETASGAEFFSSVSHSMSTLSLHGCLLEDFPTVAIAVGDDSLLVAAVLMVFVGIASLTVMNLLVGILVEVVGVVSAIENEEMTCNMVKAQMQNAINHLDGDADNLISRREFTRILDKAEVIRSLKEIGVDVVALTSLSDVIFEDGKSLNFSDFMEVVLEFRGSNVATVKDIVHLRKLVANETAKIYRLLLESSKIEKCPSPKADISPFKSTACSITRTKTVQSRFARDVVC